MFDHFGLKLPILGNIWQKFDLGVNKGQLLILNLNILTSKGTCCTSLRDSAHFESCDKIGQWV